jgi:hypothetical protein
MAHGGDSRFDEVKTKPAMFLAYWGLQAWGVIHKSDSCVERRTTYLQDRC